MIIDLKQLEDIRGKFLELSNTLRELVVNNKEYFSRIEKDVTSLVEITNKIKSISSISGIDKQFENIEHTISSLESGSLNASKSSEILQQLGVSAKKAAQKLSAGGAKVGIAKGGEEEEKNSEIAAVTAMIMATSAKLMIPIPGVNSLATTMRWMIHGVQDAMSIKAGAGELKNLLVGAYEGASTGIVNAAKQKLSDEQTVLDKFYNINKSAIQSTVSAFAKSGVAISDMTKSVDSDLGLVGESLASFATAVDLRLNMSSGSSARGMVELVTTYNESIDTAKGLFTKLAFLGRETGVGPEQFIKNVMNASSHLTTFGVSTEYVADMMVNLQEKIVGMGLEKQFAGKFVAEGVAGISEGLDSVSDNWKYLIAEQMGWGMGMEGVMNYDDQIKRLVTMSREDRQEDFEKLLSTTYKVVEGLSRGNRGTMYLAFKESLGYGISGAQLMMKFGEAFKSGDVFSQHDISSMIREDMKNTLVTESEKTNKFQLLMNQWLTYVGQIGRGILTLLMEALANMMLFMRNIGAIVSNIPEIIKAMLPGSKTSAAELLGKLNWSVNPEIGNAGRKGISEALAGMGNVMKEMAIEAGGPGAEDLYESLGVTRSNSPMESNFIMVPVNNGSAPISVPRGNQVSSGGGFSGGMAKSIFSGNGGEPLRIVTKGVDELGNIRMILKGNCPNCGLAFGGSNADLDEKKPYEVKRGKGSNTELPRESISAYSGAGPVPLVKTQGQLGGKFRRQSLRPGAEEGRAHAGIDVPAKVGTPIYSPDEGKVIHVGEAKGAGRNVQIQHPSGKTSWFMHLDKIANEVKVGANLKKGAAVGTVGRTQDVGGKGTTSPHLHYEVLKPGVSSAGAVAKPVSHSQEAFDLREDPESFIESTGSSIFEEKRG
jgi:hypothetical protein